MTISGVEHRARTGLHANVIASTTGTRNHVSYIYNNNFNIFSTISGLYRQTKTDRTGQTRQTFISLASVIFLYFYMISIDLIIAGQLLCTSLTSHPNKVYFSQVYYPESLRCLTNWAVITVLFLLGNSRQNCNVFSRIYKSYKTSNLSRSSYWMIPINFFKNSALFYTTIINLLLIVITTPSIVNPGPQLPNIKVSYCNAQGFILSSSMRGSQPIFQTRKLLDFQSFLHLDKPDIAIVNETWLNEHINSNEIVNEQYYKCFRMDRSSEDKEKYNKVGGGGL